MAFAIFSTAKPSYHIYSDFYRISAGFHIISNYKVPLMLLFCNINGTFSIRPSAQYNTSFVSLIHRPNLAAPVYTAAQGILLYILRLFHNYRPPLPPDGSSQKLIIIHPKLYEPAVQLRNQYVKSLFISYCFYRPFCQK